MFLFDASYSSINISYRSNYLCIVTHVIITCYYHTGSGYIETSGILSLKLDIQIYRVVISWVKRIN